MGNEIEMKDAKTLPEVFRCVVARIMEGTPSECSDWRLNDDSGKCQLLIPNASDDGFEISVLADEHEVTVYTSYLVHQHFTSDGNHEALCQRAMGLVRDLLSPGMRVRVVEIGGKPVRADLESFRNSAWHRESTTALFSLPWFR